MFDFVALWLQSGVYFCDSTDTSFNHPDPNSGQCYYRISYAEQSSSEGKLVTDMFTFPNNITRVPVTFGCENGETGEIFKQKPDGILGMGFSPGAFHSQVIRWRVLFVGGWALFFVGEGIEHGGWPWIFPSSGW